MTNKNTMITFEKTMTTFRRADGELIGDGYGWVDSLEWFDYDDDHVELVEEEWVLQRSKVFTHCPKSGDECCECSGHTFGEGIECELCGAEREPNPLDAHFGDVLGQVEKLTIKGDEG